MEKRIYLRRLSNGNVLRGIVTLPADMDSNKRGVFILGAGVNPRQSWHRLTVKIAQLVAGKGFLALRVDPQGVGDSDGEIEGVSPEKLEKFHDLVQTGFFVEDCRAALDGFREGYGLTDIVIIGLCGGALTGLFLAESSSDIKGLAYVAGPVTLASLDVSLPVVPAESEGLFKGYLKRILRLGAWWNLVTGKSDYSAILFLLRLKAYRILGREHKILEKYARNQDEQGLSGKEGTDGNIAGSPLLNPLVPKAFDAFMAVGGNILFILAEIDQATWGFRNLFVPNCLVPGKKLHGSYRICDIPRSNHTFSSDDAQKNLLTVLEEWIEPFRGMN